MRRFLPPLLALVVISSNIPAYATSFTGMEKKVEAAVVKVQSGKLDKRTYCSGVVINKAKAVVVTANHCLPSPEDLAAKGQSVIADGNDAVVLRRNEILDLAVLKVTGANFKGELVVSDADELQLFDEVVAAGFGVANDSPLYSAGRVSGRMKGSLAEPLNSRNSFDILFVKGQSGGAIVNQQGELVSIVQFSFNHGFGVTPKQLREFTKDFLPERMK